VSGKAPAHYFDPVDLELVRLVNDLVDKGTRSEQLSQLFDPYLHPRGIKELAAASEQRIAYAVIQLLDSLQTGRASDRIVALRSLRDEVLNNTSSSLRVNTARVLLAIMKELIREHGNEARQVRLAHDFFAASSGKAGVIRRELAKYHLLEMPESWSQIAFDHHVHDAHTKGRKSPTHLITDAWLKGIRELNVIYYNFIRAEAATELSEAAEIMGVNLRIGIEVPARFYDKYVPLIWTPRGFSGRDDFIEFLDEPPVKAFFAEGEQIAEYRKLRVLKLLDSFNARHRLACNEKYGLDLEELQPEDFVRFVGVGQASVAHLAEYIHSLALPMLQERQGALQMTYAKADTANRARIEVEAQALNDLVPETITQQYLRADVNPGVLGLKAVADGDEVPALLKLTPRELVARLGTLRTGYRLTLNPTGLSSADVLELLYDCEGAITHMEVFNLKDHRSGGDGSNPRLARLRRTLNSGSPIAVKHAIQDTMAEVEASTDPAKAARLAKLRVVLRNIPRFIGFYADTHLRARIGSDSIGRARSHFGMGLVVRDTLPQRVQRELRKLEGGREVVPLRMETKYVTEWTPRHSRLRPLNWLFAGLRAVRGLRLLAYDLKENHVVDERATRVTPKGNVVTLGGIDPHPCNGFALKPATNGVHLGWRYLNSSTKNTLRVVIGFLPAFLTFYLTKDWWVLAWFGAVIWFGITGARNIVQSVVAGGGLLRSTLIRWRNLVSWQRVTESLLFTGFSVPLLDWLVKAELLDKLLGITTAQPVLLYSSIALANGIYLFTHNTLRGLPRGAAVGNLFRSVLSIPIALGLNALALQLLLTLGWSELLALAMLQKWAAIIGKAASDAVASVIEGSADRNLNMRTRHADYDTKLKQVLDIHGRLETLLPEANVLELLSSPKELLRSMGSEAEGLQRRLTVNALDLMYFWRYQPRARSAFREILGRVTNEERCIIIGAQRILERERAITQMFLDNLVGRKFSRALAFYLESWSSYLSDMDELDREIESEQRDEAAKNNRADAVLPKVEAA